MVDKEMRFQLRMAVRRLGMNYRRKYNKKPNPEWRGIRIIKSPNDLINYSEVIYETKPEIVVEIGTKFGGSALFFQDMLDINNNGGRVITIDVRDMVENKDPRIDYIHGSSLDEKVIAKVLRETENKKTMLSIDGRHKYRHVMKELEYYHNIVSVGYYLVVEDCYNGGEFYGPGRAKKWFLKNYKNFKQTNRCEKFIIGSTMDSWLIRKR